MGVDVLIYINIKDLKKLISENYDDFLNLVLKACIRWHRFLSELKLENAEVIRSENLKEHLATYNGVIRERPFWYKISNCDIICIPDISPLVEDLDKNPNYIDISEFYHQMNELIKSKFDEIVRAVKQKYLSPTN